MRLRVSITGLLLLFAGCVDDGNGPTEADDVGVAEQCSVDEDCNQDVVDENGNPILQCLTGFKGGYCGLMGCMLDEDCPQGSACVAHTDGTNYCFRICANKPECNYNRSPDNEANCSSNITFTDGGGGKACVPPSG
jgi:hypothetical protein